MPDFDKFIKQLEENIKKLAKTDWADFRNAAITDGESFLNQSKEDLRRWTKALAQGDLSKEDFEFLFEGQTDLAEMAALKEAGLAAVRLEKFKNALISLVIDSVFDTFL